MPLENDEQIQVVKNRKNPARAYWTASRFLDNEIEVQEMGGFSCL